MAPAYAARVAKAMAAFYGRVPGEGGIYESGLREIMESG